MKGRKNKESTKIGPDQEIIRVIKNMEKVKKIETETESHNKKEEKKKNHMIPIHSQMI